MNREAENTLMAVLFASGDPISAQRIAAALSWDEPQTVRLLDGLHDALEEQDGALQLLRLDTQYQLATRERFTPAIAQVLAERRKVPLSAAALEVLATVAYNQPVTRAYVEQVRGVDSSGTMVSLMEKGLLEEAGRLDLPGRPIAYRTTANFLRTFGLASLDALPPSRPNDPPPDPSDDRLGADESPDPQGDWAVSE